MTTPRTVKHDFVPSKPYANYCGECALNIHDHNPGPDYVDSFDTLSDVLLRFIERMDGSGLVVTGGDSELLPAIDAWLSDYGETALEEAMR